MEGELTPDQQVVWKLDSGGGELRKELIKEIGLVKEEKEEEEEIDDDDNNVDEQQFQSKYMQSW